ncbi:Vms1/Ankzf1 family peptidyl-tRNA hydrolase [Streptomyces sp. DSM 44917]|uniref:Vms1/Ankzf1 family peptidyl-tRNA hydrolase n=1 Tax=Streptomyces boetiae TaxID=3075541 RepID=A0ABU2L5L1_9ACTN|nr:Vms1/Ankzf1 family peptidyl-tRNA hydrolase [Streptomyces sp. DSM 44917]MDT0306598.1 Vms1/Ankzf1 family peptidyl-tRNA hydrolase [Streptomyces sp. DSM 44917]
MNLAFLAPLLERQGPWASAYLETADVSEDAEAVRELQARDAASSLAGLGADEATCRAVRDALASVSRDDAGHAVFAAGGEVVLDVPLATPPPSPPRAFWAALPRIAPLLDHAGQDPTCLVAYVDRRGADLEMRGTHGRPTPAGSVAGRQWPIHRTGRADWSERHFQFAVENTWEENAARVAGTLAEDAERAHAGMVVLAGDPRERRAVHERLPEALREVTVESEHGARAAGSDDRLLDADVERARAERARAEAEEALERFHAARVLGSGGGNGRIDAAEGVPALVDAAREHRIAALLMRPGGADLHRDVWVGQEPDQVALRRTDSRALGAPEPAPARADDALLRSAAATGATAVPLPDPTTSPRQIPVGGLGALLRWPYEGTIPGGGVRPGE